MDVFVDNLSAVYSEAIPMDDLRALAPEFAGAVERYERLTEAMQLLSFDQIILKAVDGLRPGGPLRPLLEGRVREVLVDEYQDLNRAQEALLKALRELGANLTVVGDDDQAIYQWRGGDVSLFVDFPSRHGGTTATLTENHRSAPSIVRVSAAFAATIEPRVAKTMVPSRPDCGPRVEVVAARDPDDEAASIARRIQSLLADAHRPGDIAVLYRSVRTSAEPLAHALREAGIPATIAGRVSLLDRPEMRLLARVFVLWAGGTWRPNEVEEWVRPEDLVDEIVSVAGKSREEAAGAVLRIQEMGRELAARGVADLVRTYMEVLSVLGLPCGSGADSARQERALGSMSALLVDFEHSMKRAAPPPGSGLEWLNGTGLDAEAEVAEERAWDVSSFGGKLVPGEVFLARLKVFLERFAPPIAPALGFGKVAHHVVCEMARRARLNALPSPSDAATILQERFYLPFASRAQREAMLDALNRRLANYIRRHGADLARTLDVERRFEVPLDGARLRGRIDLLLRAAGPDPSAVEIVDIKTAENRPPLPQHQNQLRLYAQAARTLGLKPVRLLIHDLDSEDGAAIPVEENPAELARFQEDMCRWVHGIRSACFVPRRGPACGGCDYARLC